MNKNYRWLALSVVLTILAYGVWISYQDQDEIYGAIGTVGIQGFLFLCVFSSANYLIRYVRWHYLLGVLGDKSAFREGLLCYVAGFALTTTPAKAGEAVRSLYFKRRQGIDYSHTLSTLLTERTMDVLSALLVGTLALYTFESLHLLGVVLTIIIIAVIAFIIYQERALGLVELLRFIRFTWFQHILDAIPVFLARARTQIQPRPFTLGLVLGLVAWLVEGFAFAWLAARLGGEASPLLYMSIFCIALVVGALTFLPGGLGSTEAVIFGLLVASGLGNTEALAATLLMRLATLWYAILLGLIAILCLEYGDNKRRLAPRDSDASP